MKIESMRTRPYRSFKVDDADLPAEARKRLSAIRYDELRAAGCAEQAALKVIGVSRRTTYRWKAALAASGQRGLAPKSTRRRRVRRWSCKPSDVKAVLDLRRRHPFMGKAPIQHMLERKGLRLSVSTVGRILSRAIAAGVVPLASICEGRVKPRRRQIDIGPLPSANGRATLQVEHAQRRFEPRTSRPAGQAAVGYGNAALGEHLVNGDLLPVPRWNS